MPPPNVISVMPSTDPDVDFILQKSNIELIQAVQTNSDPARLAQNVQDELLRRAGQPKHASFGKSCLRLCWFVERCTNTSSSPLRQWAFSPICYSSLFGFYMDCNETESQRFMKLVLDLLALLLSQQPQPKAAESIKAAILKTLLEMVTGTSSRPATKSTLKILDHLLSKHILNFPDVATAYRDTAPEFASLDDLSLWKEFTIRLVHLMEVHHMCPAAGKLVVTSIRGLHALDSLLDFNTSTWKSWLEGCLHDDPDLLENIKTYIFMPLFKTDRLLSLSFLETLIDLEPEIALNSQQLNVTALLQLAALEVGKKTSLVEDPSSKTVGSVSKQVVVLHENVLRGVLRHPTPEIRSLAFSLLISSSATTRPYSTVAFNLLRDHLPLFHADPDAKFRYELLGHSKDMARRIKGATRMIRKNTARLQKAYDMAVVSEDEASSLIQSKAREIDRQLLCLQHHDRFFKWYLDFLRDELIPTASYQRHFTALKAMNFLLKYECDIETPGTGADNTHSPTAILSVDARWSRLLSDLVMNPFDDVRETATATFMMLLTESKTRPLPLWHVEEKVDSRGGLEDSIQSFRAKADELATQTGRADHADGVAKITGLSFCWSSDCSSQFNIVHNMLNHLDRRLDTAQADLGAAVLDAPVHGIFAALCGVWKLLSKPRYTDLEQESLIRLQERMVSLCRRVWEIVKHVLCDDSPEGHLPRDMEEVEGLDTKNLLSYSFRAVHESSNLLRALVSNLRVAGHTTGTPYPPRTLFEHVGNLTFSQLADLRHRGAFTTVSHTFIVCCQSVKHTRPLEGSNPKDTTMLDIWYNGALDCIFGQASTTRRSAGIPALLVGILSAYAQRPSFDEVISKLQEIGRREAWTAKETADATNLPQVHALNCIKEVFKSSFLRQRSERHLAECLQLAADSLKSEVWAIRNCGLLLLRSLIDCLFGTSDSKAMMESGWDGRTNRISFTRYATLPTVLRGLLERTEGEEAAAPVSAEKVFPALDIIRRAGPPESVRGELFALISEYLGSRIWHVREIAARTLCSFFLHEKWVSDMMALARDTRGSSNRAHGILLTARFLLERWLMGDLIHMDLDQCPMLITAIETGVANEIERCTEVRAAYLEILNIIANKQMSNRIAPSFPAVATGLDGRYASLALLRTRVYLTRLHQVVSQRGSEDVGILVAEAIMEDTDTALSILELTPRLWGKAQTGKEALALTNAYIYAMTKTRNSQVQAVVLAGLVQAMDALLQLNDTTTLPSDSQLNLLWSCIAECWITPSLANASIRASGPIIAAMVLRSGASPSTRMQQAILGWGIMMQSCGSDDKIFDTRFAAAESLSSFFGPLPAPTSEIYLLPLLALYDALNDDEEEIRELAALAASPALGASITSIEASPALLLVLLETFGHLPEFKAHVANRIVGNIRYSVTPRVDNWATAASQLEKAMPADLSLFMVEKQNLFVDEVREAQRWTEAFSKLEYAADDPALEALYIWTSVGLDELVSLAEEEEDGRLGWASKPSVYAICTRIILGAVTLARNHKPELKPKLEAFQGAAKRNHVHGLLVLMADI